MSAKAYDKKTAAFAGYVIQNIPADLTDEIMDGWMNNPAAMKSFLAELAPPKTGALAKRKPLLTVIATTNLDAVKGKKTTQCFRGGDSLVDRSSSCFSDFAILLSTDQSDTGECIIAACEITSDDLRFAEAVQVLSGVKQTINIACLGRSLIANGYTVTLPQIEKVIEYTAHGKETGLRKGNIGYFFFVETGNEENPVSICSVSSSLHHDLPTDRFWYADLEEIYDRPWKPFYRFFIRSLDVSKL